MKYDLPKLCDVLFIVYLCDVLWANDKNAKALPCSKASQPSNSKIGKTKRAMKSHALPEMKRLPCLKRLEFENISKNSFQPIQTAQKSCPIPKPEMKRIIL